MRAIFLVICCCGQGERSEEHQIELTFWSASAADEPQERSLSIGLLKKSGSGGLWS